MLAGRDGYTVTGGGVRWEGADLLALAPEARARAGLFLAFQYPVELPGVGASGFLRQAVNSCRVARGAEALDPLTFARRLREAAAALGVREEMLKRPVNVGFSGGEKKRFEVLQMTLLEPRLAVLDETDSGLDIDALREVAAGVERLRTPERAFIVITHYQRLLDHLRPDYVHILAGGHLSRSGGPELALALEKDGYAGLIEPQPEAAA